MGVQYDEGAVVDFESNRCLSCGDYGNVHYCVRCRAKELNASEGATIRLVTTDQFGRVTKVEEVWVN